MDAEAALWDDYLAERGLEARNRLVEYFMAFAGAVAERVSRKLSHSSDWDRGDLDGWAMQGLIHAVEHFDPARGVKLTSFSVPRINGAIFDGLRSIDPAPRLMRTREKQGRETVPTVTSWEAIRARQSWDNDKTEPAYLGNDPAVQKASDMDFWREVLGGRSSVERIILLLYYRQEMTMKEIGKSLGLSESRVSQIHSAVIQQMRERLSARLPHLVPRPIAPQPAEEPEAMPTSTTQAALPVEEGQRPGLKFLLTDTTPASIESQIALHVAAIMDHRREIQAWRALLECLQTLERNPITCSEPTTPPPEPATGSPRCTKEAVAKVFEGQDGPLAPAAIATALGCPSVNVSQCLAHYADTFERVDRGLWKLRVT